MDRSHLSAVEREQLLDEIVTAYLKALEEGQTPDRREWLNRHPELAGELQVLVLGSLLIGGPAGGSQQRKQGQGEDALHG